MSKVIWKAAVFVSVIHTLWLISELFVVGFLVGLDEAFEVLVRHNQPAVKGVIEVITSVIGLWWLVMRISTSSAQTNRQGTWQPPETEPLCWADNPVSETIVEGSWEAASDFLEIDGGQDVGLIIETSSEELINPANGMLMNGAFDVMGNPFGTDTFSGSGFDIEDSFSITDSGVCFESEVLVGCDDAWI